MSEIMSKDRFICGGCSVDVFDKNVPDVGDVVLDGQLVVAGSSSDDDDLDPEAWSPGDVILCCNCGRFSLVEPDMSLREATRAEVDAEYDTPELQAAMGAMVKVVKTRGLSVRPSL